jgi:hypothetical protein
MDFENVAVQYVVKQTNVPYVGDFRAVVDISREPKFDNSKSIDVLFFSDADPASLTSGRQLGASSISYASIKADNYRNRISVKLVLPSGCLMSRTLPYQAARDATKKLLPQLIAEHERLQAKAPATQ